MISIPVFDVFYTQKIIYKKLILLCWMICSIFLIVSCTKNIPSDEVPAVKDWMNGFLKVKGYGSLDFHREIGERRFHALQTAKRDAYDQIRRKIYSLPIGDQKRVQDLVSNKKELAMKVERFVKTAKVTQTVIVRRGGIEVDMELYLGASLKSILDLVEKVPTYNKNQLDLHDKPGL